jgi:hypothetical protein
MPYYADAVLLDDLPIELQNMMVLADQGLGFLYRCGALVCGGCMAGVVGVWGVGWVCGVCNGWVGCLAGVWGVCVLAAQLYCTNRHMVADMLAASKPAELAEAVHTFRSTH